MEGGADIMPKLSTLDAILLIEGGEGEEDEIIEAWQLLIDTGLVWQLQGFYGRGAKHMIENGLCEPASNERLKSQLEINQ
jgi:hypothetical protein